MRTFAIVTRTWNPDPTATGYRVSQANNRIQLRPGEAERFRPGMQVRVPGYVGSPRCGTATVTAVEGDMVVLDDASMISGFCNGDILFEWVVREITVGLECGDDEALAREIVEQALGTMMAFQGQGDLEIAKAVGNLLGAAAANRRWFVEVGRANDDRHRVRAESD